MTRRLENKIALVTGGGAGIGEATALRFAEEGAHLIVTDIDGEAARETAEAIRAAGGSAESAVQDVCDEERWQALVDDILSRHGALHVLVNNAGIAIVGNVEEASAADWRRTQAVNGESVFFGTRAAVGAMKDCGGSIINISSIEGIIGEDNAAAYNYSKAGVRVFTKSAALHCARQGYPIRVNSVHPGFIATAIIDHATAALSPERAESWMARVQGEIPVGAMGEPRDIANGCLFLASEESRYMTGSELVIDGGYTCH